MYRRTRTRVCIDICLQSTVHYLHGRVRGVRGTGAAAALAHEVGEHLLLALPRGEAILVDDTDDHSCKDDDAADGDARDRSL